MINGLICAVSKFQSTLPRGSDWISTGRLLLISAFQSTLPRGSDDKANDWAIRCVHISIHAPSRERRRVHGVMSSKGTISIHAPSRERPAIAVRTISLSGISIHAPSRERQHQNKLLLYSFKSSIFCELAQLKYSKIYFDVRKLIVSHSSLSCEPKLNFMFHITSHRIILHYFYSCQSICK